MLVDTHKNKSNYLSDETVSADIKLETETEDGLSVEDVPSTLSPNSYHPRLALKNAVKEWLPEFAKHKAAWGPIAKPQPAIAGMIDLISNLMRLIIIIINY